MSDIHKFLRKQSKGFTLIELLFVISIIGLLSSVIFVSVNSARKDARNTYRNKMAEEYAKAFYLYYDANGEYPDPMDGSDTSPYPGVSCLAKVPAECIFVNPVPSNEILNNKLSPYIEIVDPFQMITSRGGNYQGPLYTCKTDIPCIGVRLLWFLEGREICPSGAISGLLDNNTTACHLYLEEVF
ncbi:MAG: hypothetical protein COU71_01760 [Parcubacteria group bacterium CG10_big_fil_rev_8_21_14_0_10_38_31]|nr:MAG: hypothetical protein COU71_01760 [Parcubacteria group bacterium CG10_big_fil_rev_8_21_14_0_10_38_31]